MSKLELIIRIASSVVITALVCTLAGVARRENRRRFGDRIDRQ